MHLQWACVVQTPYLPPVLRPPLCCPDDRPIPTPWIFPTPLFGSHLQGRSHRHVTYRERSSQATWAKLPLSLAVIFKPLHLFRRLLRVPWTARRSKQSILKETNPEYSMDDLMLKLKSQYFGHLLRRADSFEKTPMLVKIEVRRTHDRG